MPLRQGSSIAASASVGLSVLSVTNVPMEQEGGDGDDNSANPPLKHQLPPIVWSSDTDLVFLLGMTRLTLTIQSPLLCDVITDSFENLQAFLLFNHSFPDGAAIPTVMRDCLITAAAESRNPRGPIIRDQMNWEDGYLDHLLCLVSVL